MKHSGSNANAIAGHERSSSSKQCIERDLAGSIERHIKDTLFGWLQSGTGRYV